MAFRVVRVALPTSTATVVFTAQPGDVEIRVAGSGTSNTTVGDASVATGGFNIDPGSHLSSRVRPGDELWAFHGAAGKTVEILVRSA